MSLPSSNLFSQQSEETLHYNFKFSKVWDSHTHSHSLTLTAFELNTYTVDHGLNPRVFLKTLPRS